MTVDFELDGQVHTLPMPALINLHSHPDEEVRRRAYEAELKAWKTVEGPLCAAMNGVKGDSQHAQPAPRAQRCPPCPH